MNKGQLIDVIREKPSNSGNPRYTCIIRTAAGYVEIPMTAPNSGIAYEVNNLVGKNVQYNTTIRRNVLTLTDIAPLQLNDRAHHMVSEIDALPVSLPADATGYKLQISGDGEKTKWMTINTTQLRQIRDILALSDGDFNSRAFLGGEFHQPEQGD